MGKSLMIAVVMLVACFGYAGPKDHTLREYCVALIRYCQSEHVVGKSFVATMLTPLGLNYVSGRDPRYVDEKLVKQIIIEINKCPYTKDLNTSRKMVLVWYIYNHPSDFYKSKLFLLLEKGQLKEAGDCLANEDCRLFWNHKEKSAANKS